MSTFSLPAIFIAIPRNPVLAVGLPLALGTLSGLPTSNVVKTAWYQNLRSPPGRPPNGAFPIVWSTLYIAMGYASRLAVKALDSSLLPATQDTLRTALALYWGQLALNLLWTPLFFGLKRPGLALLDCTALTGTTVYLTTLLHEPTGGQSTWLLAPYCAWLGWATYLNAGIWWLNRDLKPSGKKY
ncbi:TspO/MBR-like protein [Sistotremastrum niveocremeum HHB9708]|uniref:TspO/MBR-like protein n=2 Tax=Sistotremastraceae TaxID=3402574 RepID=A0A164ZQZ8_9AGAM|nr:TspO/MBR-like protein [Sistotremastrum niveocremeum HHB9708]KZT36821.1 TspO/MBR-related protein [Sistotremastrum suecicum HHB10207 ss-3]